MATQCSRFARMWQKLTKPSTLSKEKEFMSSVSLYFIQRKINTQRYLFEKDTTYIEPVLSDHTNQDWWFVKKHLTDEKGWVPAQYLLNEIHYTHYLQRKLHEKIDKLPVFESKFTNECNFNLSD